MKLAEKILTLRKQKGLSQEELAEKLNVSRQAVSRWEMGTALPDASNILQLSKLFEVSTDYLLNEDYNSDQDIPAVKNQKDFILLIGIQIVCFIFHIICCFVLVYPIFPMISLIINTLLVMKLSKEFDIHHLVNKKTSSLYLSIYVCVIWLMAYLPFLTMNRILFSLFGSELPSFTYAIFGCIICIIPAVITIRFIIKKRETN